LSTITISAKAYSAVEMMKKAMDSLKAEWISFPEGDFNKFQLQKELIDKKVIQKKGERKDAKFTLIAPYESIKKSDRVYGGNTKGQKTQEIRHAQTSKTASTYKKLPSFDLVSQFIGAVVRESKELSQERHESLTKQVDELKKKLVTATGDTEYKLHQELSRLIYERRSLKGALTVEAMKNVASESEYRSIDWSQVISHDLHDYEAE